MLYFQISNYNKPFITFNSIEQAYNFINQHKVKYAIYNIVGTSDSDGLYKFNSTQENFELGTKVYNGEKHTYLRFCSIEKLQNTPITKCFTDIFGTCKSSRGSIRNKILLNFWKFRFKRDFNGDNSRYDNLTDLFYHILDAIDNYIPEQITIFKRPILGNDDFYSIYHIEHLANHASKVYVKFGNRTYALPSNKYCSRNGTELGYCIDDPKCITVIDMLSKAQKPVRVKACKVFLDSMLTCHAEVGQQTLIYCAEEFQRLWELEVSKLLQDLTLHVDKNFRHIYDSVYHAFKIDSCMNNKGQYTFYQKSVNASAAYLTGKNGKILARCVIFHGVKSKNDESVFYNYAERQYANSEYPIYKYILIEKLLQEGYIDIYKVVGAGCADVHAIMDKNGKQLPQSNFYIPCDIKYGDTLSYQDTFKFYYPEKKIACNYREGDYYRELGHTNAIYQFKDNIDTDI